MYVESLIAVCVRGKSLAKETMDTFFAASEWAASMSVTFESPRLLTFSHEQLKAPNHFDHMRVRENRFIQSSVHEFRKLSLEPRDCKRVEISLFAQGPSLSRLRRIT